MMLGTAPGLAAYKANTISTILSSCPQDISLNINYVHVYILNTYTHIVLLLHTGA